MTNKSKRFKMGSMFEMGSMASLLLCRGAEVCCKKDEIVFLDSFEL